MNRKIAALLAIGLILSAAFAAIPACAQVPILPHAFFGAAEVNGNLVSVGVQVEARGVGVKVGIEGNPIIITADGRYGGPTFSETKLIVQGDIEEGTPIEFYIGGARAQIALPGGAWQDSYPFEAGAITELDLRTVEAAPPTSTATQAPPTATIVSTQTPTLAPALQPSVAPMSSVAGGPTATTAPIEAPTTQPVAAVSSTVTPGALPESATATKEVSTPTAKPPDTPTPVPSLTATSEPTLTVGPSPTPRPTSPPVLAMVPAVTPAPTPANTGTGLVTEGQSGRLSWTAWLALIGLAIASGVLVFGVASRRRPAGQTNNPH